MLSIVWNPPTGIDLGFFTLRFYSLCFAIAFILGVYISKKMYKSEGLKEDDAYSLLFWVFWGTLIGARLGHCIFYEWAYYKDHIWEIFLPVEFNPFRIKGFYGLASHGAAIGIVISIFFFAKKVVKKPFLWVLDRLVIVVALGGAFVRIGNLMNSEIIGKPTGSSFGVVFKVLGESFPRHPAQIYEAIAYFIIFIILYSMYKRGYGKIKGYIFGWFLVLLFGARFIVEFFKENQEAFEDAWVINMGQVLSIPFILVGVFLIVYLHFKKEKI